MEIKITETVWFDNRPVQGEQKISFFTESTDPVSSITDLTEEQIIKWIFRRKTVANFFVSRFFKEIANIRAYIGVTEPFVAKNKKPGDIDILLVHPSHPDQVFVFEVKRVKATALDEERAKVNGTQNIVHGIDQVNGYQSLGFSNTYYLVIILNDARKRTSPNILTRHTDGFDVERVYTMPYERKIHDHIGVCFADIAQITGRSIQATGRFGICVDRPSVLEQQTPPLTRMVNEFIKKSNHPYITFPL